MTWLIYITAASDRYSIKSEPEMEMVQVVQCPTWTIPQRPRDREMGWWKSSVGQMIFRGRLPEMEKWKRTGGCQMMVGPLSSDRRKVEGWTHYYRQIVYRLMVEPLSSDRLSSDGLTIIIVRRRFDGWTIIVRSSEDWTHYRQTLWRFDDNGFNRQRVWR